MIMLHHEGLNRWPSKNSKAFSSRQAVTVLDVAHCKARHHFEVDDGMMDTLPDLDPGIHFISSHLII